MIIVVGTLVGLVTLPLAMAAPATAATDTASAENDFVARINALRTSKGLGQLETNPELVGIARDWARKMADADEISHNPDLAGLVKADWRKLGENVGVGMTVASLHDAFVNSPAHYRNLVDPEFTAIGVGVVVGRGGALFTAHQFMRLRPVPTPTTARPAPAPAPVEAAAPIEIPGDAPPDAAAPAPDRLVLVLEQLRDLDPR